MKIIVLSDNAQNLPFISEWGLSVYIEYSCNKILLDTGSGNVFALNAAKLNVDIADIDYGVLSHAHYDHANGMPYFFGMNKKADFYLRSGTLEDCYSKKGGIYGYIGIKKGVLAEYKNRIIYVDGTYRLFEGAWLVPHKNNAFNESSKSAGMFRYGKNGWTRDDFTHEQSLVIESDSGLVIFNSCSHGGADNIISEVSEAFPDKKIYAMVGGVHLYKSSKEDVLTLCKKIKETGVEKIITGHCTENAFELIKKEFGDRASQIFPGFEMNIV